MTELSQTCARLRRRLGISAVVVSLALPLMAHAAAEVSFRNDMMAVLSKAGCNMGACHGNKSGKGGFKLSLRGEDPAGDYSALVRDMFGRRVNPIEPEESLLLLKPATDVAHEGGNRLKKGSEEYELLRRWIAAGSRDDHDTAPALTKIEVTPREQFTTPDKPVQIKATATYADGSKRDVTRLSCYEANNTLLEISAAGQVKAKQSGETTVLVRYLNQQLPVTLAFVPERKGFQWGQPTPNNVIDEQVFAKLRRLRLNPSPVCGDEIFLRRAYLDLLGIVPTRDEARAFLTDKTNDKRTKLVDRLLGRSEFADFWGLKWSDLLRNEERTLDQRGVKTFHAWIRQSIADNKPLDRFAAELMAARGSTYSNAPANFFRALRDPVSRAEATAQVFLGVRLQCAQCHNHPFDRWTMDDYYDWAGVFARIDYKIIENKRTDKSDKHEFKGEQLVQIRATGSVTNARTGKASSPRFLGEAKPVQPADGEDVLQALSKWLVRVDNQRFAAMQANRIWYHLMGRGLVDPLDDFRATNPASHPALLDALAAELVKSKFDQRHLIRLIMASKSYQLASEPNGENADDVTNYSHALIRRLTAEQLLDATSQAAGVPLDFDGYPAGTRAGQLPGPMPDGRKAKNRAPLDQFLATFGKPPRLSSTECERVSDPAIGQVFQMMSGPVLQEFVARKDNRVGKLLDAGKSAREIIEELYWDSLTRAPSPAEAKRYEDYVNGAKDRRAAFEDVLWALLNAKEFVLRR